MQIRQTPASSWVTSSMVELKRLLRLSGLQGRLLHDCLGKSRDLYRQFSIPKRNGKPRLISAPSEPLKELQRRMLKGLNDIVEWLPCAHGFVPGRGTSTMAYEAHRYLKGKRSAIAICADLENAFPSVNEGWINSLLKEAGCSKAVARVIARSTTDKQKAMVQGAPLAPSLLNLALAKVDRAMMKLAKQHKGLWLRYADDCVLLLPPSTDEKAVKKQFRAIIRAAGWTIHPTKNYTQRLDEHHRSIHIVGWSVNQQGVRLHRDIRHRARGWYKLAKWIGSDAEVLSNRGKPVLLECKLNGYSRLLLAAIARSKTPHGRSKATYDHWLTLGMVTQ